MALPCALAAGRCLNRAPNRKESEPVYRLPRAAGRSKRNKTGQARLTEFSPGPRSPPFAIPSHLPTTSNRPEVDPSPVAATASPPHRGPCRLLAFCSRTQFSIAAQRQTPSRPPKKVHQDCLEAKKSKPAAARGIERCTSSGSGPTKSTFERLVQRAES